MPVLFVLLLLLCVRSLTLPGAAAGLHFFCLRRIFFPHYPGGDFNGSGPGLFFKLSVGMGTMLTYGSYFRDNQNIPATAGRVMLADLSISLLAGMAIFFPAVFTFHFQPTDGPGLVFLTIPSVFASLPGGAVFTILFFLC